jgi:hypothetical protein
LVSAFLKDLSHVLDTQASAIPTRPVFFYAVTGATASWTADADYVLIGFVCSGSGNTWKFGSDSANPSGVGVTGVFLDTNFGGGPFATNQTQLMSGIRIPIPEKTKLFLVNATASSMGLTAYLQRS